MTTSEQKSVLEEFTDWQSRRASETPDLSTTAFLAERDAEDALARVAKATQRVHNAKAILDRGQLISEEEISTLLNRLDHDLSGDLDVIEERTFGSSTIRRITA